MLAALLKVFEVIVIFWSMVKWSGIVTWSWRLLPTGKSAITGICNNNNHIIHTLYVHCWKIYHLFARDLETSRKTNFSVLFRSEYKWNIYFLTIHIWYLSCYVKIPKTPIKLCNKQKKRVVLIVFYIVLSVRHALIL